MADAGLDRSGIERNANGSEEPHSEDPELWNIDGTEMDLSAKYKMGAPAARAAPLLFGPMHPVAAASGPRATCGGHTGANHRPRC